MAKRYELPDEAWELIADVVSPEQKRVRPCSDDRLKLNGIFWILCSGAAWRDLPERFGLGRRCIRGFVTGEMTARSIGFSRVYTFI
nr:transposase [uncultured Pseudomonas sp.]